MTRPHDLFSAMRDEMDRVFGQFERGLPGWPALLARGGNGHGMVMPEFDVHEGKDAITIEVELPGVDEKDVTVTIADGVLMITGEKKQEKVEKSENYHIAERVYGAFSRSLRLPDSIDETKVEAKFDKGVLTISAAKKPEAMRAERKIEVKKAS